MPEHVLQSKRSFAPSSGRKLAGEALADKLCRVLDAEKHGEGTEPWALFLTEQDLVECLEPVAQRVEAVLLSHLVDVELGGLGVGDIAESIECGCEVFHCGALAVGRRPVPADASAGAMSSASCGGRA